MIPPILFEIPAQYQLGVESGVFRQVGALILNPTTGRILAHLQETGAAKSLTMSLLGAAPSALSAIASPISAISGFATYIQNRQILASIEAMRGLQIGGLVLNGFGIGISLVGFAVMSSKLEKISGQLTAIDERLAQIESKIDGLYQAAIQQDFIDLRAACKQIDHAWSLANPVPEWAEAVGVFYRMEDRFFTRAEKIASTPNVQLDLLENFLEAAVLAGSALVSVRTAMNDLVAAQIAANDTRNRLIGLTSGIGLSEILAARLQDEKIIAVSERVDAIARYRADAKMRASLFRNREDQAFSTLHLASHLQQNGYSGREYLETMRQHETSPLALIEHSKECLRQSRRGASADQARYPITPRTPPVCPRSSSR